MTRDNLSYYVMLYAAAQRTGMAQNGYPKQVPWYTPPRRGETDEKREDPPGVEEWEAAARVEAELNRFRAFDKKRRALVEALDIWEGAFVDAPFSKKERCKVMRVEYNQCRKAAGRCFRLLDRKLFPDG